MLTYQFILVKLPFLILLWWWTEAPWRLLKFLLKIGGHYAQVLSLPLLVKTYFVPWKNENRKGYVAIARGVGMTVRTFVIGADLLILSLYFSFALFVEIIFILTPLFAVYLLVGTWTR